MRWTVWVLMSSIFGALAVACGAFGAHGLKGRISEADLQIYELAVKYQMYHALALLGVALVASHVEHPGLKLAGIGFCVGIVLFSGSLYTMVASGYRWLGAVTPLGGLALIAGWIGLGWAVAFK
ncbi:MAG: DUF423 domain-containing protein [Oligoflexales bacterium]|nr:DUF423 domain-containing protein [Oligoflexales bacterium]